jgi:predicted secreted protein
MQQVKKWGGYALGFVAIGLLFVVLSIFAPGLALAVTFAGPVKGRSILVKRGAVAAEVTIAAVRTKALKINGEPIDVSTDDSGVWADKLQDAGQVSVSITVSGVVKDHTLLQESLVAGDRSQSTVFQYPLSGAQATPDKVQGDFFLASYQESGDYKEGAVFEAEFQSNGVVTFTAGA